MLKLKNNNEVHRFQHQADRSWSLESKRSRSSKYKV